MRWSRSALVLVACALFLGELHGVEPAATESKPPLAITSLPKLANPLRDALQDRNFGLAIKLIDESLAQSEPGKALTPGDYLLYLKGRAQTEINDHDGALATFARLEKDYSQSVWLSRARFGQAAVLAKQRNYEQAGAIYRAESERLLSGGRRDELTGIYLEFAHRFFEGVPEKGPQPRQAPDYAQALNYYQQALTLRPGLALRQQIELRIARCHQELKQYAEAVAAWQQFLAKHGPSKQPADQRASVELLVEAQYQLGQTQLDLGQPAEARKTWQDFLASETVLESRSPLIAEASYRLSKTYGMPQPPTIGDLELGGQILDQFINKFPDHVLAAEADFDRARGYLHHGRHEQAIAVLKGLIDNARYASSPQVPMAWHLLGTAYAAQQKFTEAIAAWQEFLSRYPTDSKWSEVQRQIIDTEFAAADVHFRRQEYDQARKLWETFLNKYPLDPRIALVLYRFGEMQYQSAVTLANTIKAPQTPSAEQSAEINRLLTAAIEDWRRLVSKFPDTTESSQASLMIGVVLEERLNRLADAVEAYRHVTGTHQAQAQQRLSALTSPHLQLVTERKFRSNEHPAIKLTTRNLQQVTIKLYRIDLADYFRKLHLASGVESLDIALIDPDKTVEHSVVGYEQYRQHEQNVELPIEGPGVTAVTVSSDAHEATTMVVVSDIDIIVKSSRNELFVFAENMLTGKPAEHVKLMISDGSQVFSEAETGKDGIYQQVFEQLKSIKDLRVFASQEKHAASSQVSLEGLQFSVGLAAKGYLYTDRPAYRAGQLVNIKGIIRWVSQDQYTYKEGDKYQLDVYDAQARVIHNTEVTLGKFGTFAAHWKLPAQAQPGNYRVHAHQPGRDQSYEMNFLVQEYQLEPIQFVADLPQKVYYRGEVIKGKLRLKYYYGSPLAGRAIEYRLGDDRLWTATTNAQGEVDFELPTQRYSESQSLQLVARYPERNVVIGETLFLATRGFEIGVKTVRDVYVTGETLDATVLVHDPAGQPVSTELNLEVLEVTESPAGKGERRIAEQKLQSDGKTGEVRHTLRFEHAGHYVIRATGIDRFGHSISGSHTVCVSGNEDQIRLRILADQHQFKVGDTAKIQLHWRDKPALALVTFEGSSILGYQLVELQTGTNPLDVKFAENLAPNFQLSVGVMAGSQYHEARNDFRVSRDLHIGLAPGKTNLLPGELTPVKIHVTDSQGKPVAAELSLALVQKNLLDRFPQQKALISEFFGGGSRQISCRVSSSCVFQYRPETRPINQFLLAEVERVEQQVAEKQARDLIAADDVVAIKEEADLRLNFGDNMPQAGGLGGGGAGEWSDRRADKKDRPESMGRLSKRQSGAEAEDVASDAPASDPGALAAGRKFNSDQDFDGTALDHRFLSRDPSDPSQLSYFSVGEINGVLLMAPDQPMTSNMRDTDWAWGVVSNSSTPLYAINNFGELQMVNGRSVKELKQIAAEGIQLMTAEQAAETGYWNPLIMTDDQGHATINMTLPDRSTAWNLEAIGINAIALAGRAEVELVTKQELFAEIQLPQALIAGDQALIPVEIHHAKVAQSGIDVRLKTTIGTTSTEQMETIHPMEPGVQSVNFPVKIESGDSATFEVTVSDDGHRQTLMRTVTIQPDGVPVYATSGGTSAQNTSFSIRFPENIKAVKPSLEILIGPNVDRALLETVLGGMAGPLERSIYVPQNPVERAVSDLLGGVALLKMLGLSRSSETPEAREIAGRIQAGLAVLISTQRDDGGWGWAGSKTAEGSDRYLTSRAVWAWSLARKSGFAVPQQGYELALNYLHNAFANTGEDDHETRIIILHGLAEAGACDFAHLNRLHRFRNELNASALVHLSLALIAMDRQPMARELLELAQPKLLPVPAQPAVDKGLDGCLPWMHSGVEVRGLYLLARNKVTPAAEDASEIANWLLGTRVGSRWQPEKANGPVIAALADWFGRAKLLPEKYTLTIFVNEKQLTRLAVEPGQQPSASIPVPAEFLAAGLEQKVNIDIDGRGQFTYSAILTGFVPTTDLESTEDDYVFNVHRTYEPAHRTLDGETIPRGFGHLHAPFATFTNPVTQLPVGERAEVAIDIWRANSTNLPNEHRPYLVYTEPLPAGVSVLPETVVGPFDRYEIGPGSITFYLGDRYSIGRIRFDVVGYLPGTYRRLPGVLRNFYQPDRIRVVKADPLTVLPRGIASQDEYRLTPEEDYEFGRRYFARGDYAQADEHLGRLFKSYKLNDIYGEVVQMLFQTSLVAQRHGDVVQFFETIKEKLPDIEVSFENILKVADAYRQLGEYERGYLVYRATLEAGFQRESQIAGFLNQQGEFLRSVQVMEQLLRSYPAEAYIATATFALAQEVYGKASEIDQKLRQAGVTRVALISTSVQMLDHFIATWATDPAADQASFSLANALLDLEKYPEVIIRCEQFAQRYPHSKLLDSFWYVIGYSQFARGEHEAALEMCRKVATWKTIDPQTKAETLAVNHWQALYIMGQVYHSLGQAAEAIAEYDKVKDQFADAREAIDFFTRKELTLPEITTVKPGDAAKVEMKFRNVSAAAIKVYRIDLLKFGLLNRNLSRITAINLAGIRPYHDLTVPLGDGKDYRDRTQALSLPLKDEGAYLVVCQAENLYASGLVLVSPLALEIQEDATSGRVRVTVKDAVSGNYAHGVHVKVIGSQNEQFQSGQTDLRGIYVADGIVGTSTIIAKTGANRYAFFRGKSPLGQVVTPQQQNSAPKPAEATPADDGTKALLQNLRQQNGDINSFQRHNYRSLLNNTIQGIRAKGAY